MGEKEFTKLCKQKVMDFYKQSRNYKPKEIYIVWCVKVLQNNKALLSTTWPDGLYFELTYDGDKKKLYFDAYKRQENHEFKISTIDHIE